MIFVFVFWCFFEPPLSVLHIVSFFHFFLHILGLSLISTKRQKCEIWSALHLTLWEKLPQTLMKKIGSLSSWTFCSCCCCIEDPECTWYHFRCKFHGSNPLSSPTSNSPAVDRRTDKEKTSARMDINQTEMENRREGWEKKHCKFGQTLTGWANSDFTYDLFKCFS